jgi:hypothetical protein
MPSFLGKLDVRTPFFWQIRRKNPKKSSFSGKKNKKYTAY